MKRNEGRGKREVKRNEGRGKDQGGGKESGR